MIDLYYEIRMHHYINCVIMIFHDAFIVDGVISYRDKNTRASDYFA